MRRANLRGCDMLASISVQTKAPRGSHKRKRSASSAADAFECIVASSGELPTIASRLGHQCLQFLQALRPVMDAILHSTHQLIAHDRCILLTRRATRQVITVRSSLLQLALENVTLEGVSVRCFGHFRTTVFACTCQIRKPSRLLKDTASKCS